MDSFISEDLKGSLNREYIQKFSLDKLKEGMFIPINKQEDFLYVGIVDADNRERRNSILTKIILTTKLKPKVVALTKEQFDELIETFENMEPEPVVESSQEQPSDIEVIPLNISLDSEEKKDIPPLPDVSINAAPSASSVPLSPAPNTGFKPTGSTKKKLGEQLIDEGLITPEQLNAALEESKTTGTPVGSALVKLGFIRIDDLRDALSKQQGYDHVESKDLKVEANVIRLLPEDFIKDNKVVPIRTDGKTIVVGMVNPNDKMVLNDITYLTGLKPSPLILTHIEYEKCINNFFETKRETERLMEEISLDEDIIIMEENLWQQVEKEFEDESNIVAKFASSIIIEAIEKNASDIHIEPRIEKHVVRYRIDGILKHILDVPSKIEHLLVSRLKVVARMDIAEHRRPQDGSFTLKYNNKFYNLRLSTIPVGSKEKMVIRILRPDLKVISQEKKLALTGAMDSDIKKVELMTTSPHGIILITGPTGSGKTTTLYSILNKVNNPMVNITTIEDPVEIKLDGINQIQVNPKADVTFASCMRSILRQDPDIIMIGEIRDIETLDAAIYASLTGHLVLSSLHTNSAIATITRLIKMGAPPYLIASSLVGILAQRLVRKVCPSCKETYEPTMDEIKLVAANQDDYELFEGKKIYKAVGCANCGDTGYVGRMGLYEIMPVNRELRKAITNSNVAHEIEEIAVSCGMKTLQRGGLESILKGEITIEEYVRVMGANND